MDGPVYGRKLHPLGIATDIPPLERRSQIDAFIFDELVQGELKESTRSTFRQIIEEGKDRGSDAVVLGCTEIPLLIGQSDSTLPVLDSTRILARAALRVVARRDTPAP